MSNARILASLSSNATALNAAYTGTVFARGTATVVGALNTPTTITV